MALTNAGCGRIDGLDEPVPPDADACGGAWQLVQTLGVMSSAPEGLLWDANELYYALGDPSRIEAMNAATGAVRIVAATQAMKLWIEGDNLLYTCSDDRLLSVAKAGGLPSVVVDGLTTDRAPSYAIADDHALDATFFYWLFMPQLAGAPFSIWRVARAGSAAEKLVDLPFPNPSWSWQTLYLMDDQLVVALDAQAVAYVVPKTGGNVRVLSGPPAASGPSSNGHLGATRTAVVWKRDSVVRGMSEPVDLFTSDPRVDSASPHPFWTDKPAALRPASAWGDECIVTALERFTDGQYHQSVWRVDPSGTTGRRIACDVTPDTSMTFGFAPAPDALYAVVGWGDPSSYFRYGIVRIAR